MYSWQKHLVTKLLEIQPSTTNVNMVTMKMSGLINCEEYFIATEPNGSTHPLYDLMQENEYLKRIAQGLRVQALSIPSGSRYTLNKTSSGVYNYPGLAVVKPSYTVLNLTYGEFEGEGIPAQDMDERGKVGPNISFNGHKVSMPNLGSVRLPWVATNNGKSDSRRTLSGFEAGKDYWLPFPEFIEGSPWYFMKHHFSQVGALSGSSLKELGIRARFTTDGNAMDMDLPQIVGCRRWAFIFFWSGSLVVVGGYILGEGQDCVYVNSSYWQDRDGWGDFTRGGSTKRLTFTNSNIAAKDSYRHDAIQIESWWPLSWNTDFISNIQGELTILDKVADEPIGNTLVHSQVVEMKSTRIDGFFSKTGYQLYMTGYGVYSPISGKDKESVDKYWANLPDSVMFTIFPEKCNGRSMKELPFYKEYARKRSKACKDNNYMELPYNQEFTMKQVENKLSALTSLSVWARDASLSNLVNANAGDVVIVPTTRITTIAKLTDQSFSYSVNDAAVGGQVVMTESSVTAFLDKVHPTKFAGDVAILDNFMSKGVGTLTELSSELAGGTKKGFNLNTSVYSFGNGVCYTEVMDNLDVTGQIAFLCEQITDYRNFNTKIPLLLKSVAGSSMYPKMLSEFKKVS